MGKPLKKKSTHSLKRFLADRNKTEKGIATAFAWAAHAIFNQSHCTEDVQLGVSA